MKEARRILISLIEEKEFDWIGLNTVPELDDLARALSDNNEISRFLDVVRNALWPHGFGLEFAYYALPTALRRIQRTPYPIPMYCQKQIIEGLRHDKELADVVLMQAGSEPRAIVFWTLGTPTRVYGQCNFKLDNYAACELKFCDAPQSVLDKLRHLVNDLGVRRLLFLEQDLLDKFRYQVTFRRLSAECLLINPAWLPKPLVV